MNVGDFLKTTTKSLSQADIPTARLDALILLEDATQKDRAWLLAHPEHNFHGQTLDTLNEQVIRRVHHEPLAYIRGKSEFYGREFLVTADTLQPRPETETMIDMILELASQKIIDIGTGSGCIAITSKLEMPNIKVAATDISEPCLKIARKNAKRLDADVSFLQTNLVSGLKASDLSDAVLCCNLPYVPDSFTINQAAMFEPEIAIFGGKDGLDYFRQLFEQLKDKNATPKGILTESLPTQHKALQKLAGENGYKLQNTQDFIQQFRSL